MKSSILISAIAFVILSSILACKDAEKKVTPINGRLYEGAFFAKPYQIDIVGDSTDYNPQIDSILRLFESVFSPSDTQSIVSQFNRYNNVKEAMKFNDSSRYFGIVYDIVRDLNRNSAQLFDPTSNPLKREWFKVKFAGLTGEPNLDSLYEFVSFDGAKVDLIEIEDEKGSYSHSLLRKKDPRIELDLTEIAAAYACDVLSDFFISKGVEQFKIKYGRAVLCRGVKVGDLNIVPFGITGDSTDQNIRLINAAYATANIQDKQALVDVTYGYPVDNELVFVGASAKSMTNALAYADIFMMMGFDQSAKWYEQNEDSGVQSFMLIQRDKEITSASTVGFDEMIISPEPEVSNE